MKRDQTASALWTRLSGRRQPVLDRAIRCAELTIPNLLLEVGHRPEDDANIGVQFGAHCVNSIVNKMALAMFAPSRPAFRLDLGERAAAALQLAPDDKKIVDTLAAAERKAMRELDKRPVRPKLYQLLRLLVVTGNICLDLTAGIPRVLSLRNFCVKRTIDGRLHTAVIQECIHYDELDEDVQAALPVKEYKDDSKCEYYKVITRLPNDRFQIDQWVDNTKLPAKFSQTLPEADLPYHFIPWSLADDADYGTGMVEENLNAFEALSDVAQAVIDGAVLGCEQRTLVNPSGITQVTDVQNSKNGDVLAGSPEDINTIGGTNAQQVANALQVQQELERKLGAAFLLQSAITRNAERVTAEEIRLNAYELETALGGVYSSLAVHLTLPLVQWLMKMAGLNLNGADVDLVIITGLDALSRGGDLMKLDQALESLSKLNALPPQMNDRLLVDPLTSFIGAAVGLPLKSFFMDDTAYGQMMANRAQAQALQAGATTAATTAAENQGTPQA